MHKAFFHELLKSMKILLNDDSTERDWCDV